MFRASSILFFVSLFFPSFCSNICFFDLLFQVARTTHVSDTPYDVVACVDFESIIFCFISGCDRFPLSFPPPLFFSLLLLFFDSIIVSCDHGLDNDGEVPHYTGDEIAHPLEQISAPIFSKTCLKRGMHNENSSFGKNSSSSHVDLSLCVLHSPRC